MHMPSKAPTRLPPFFGCCPRPTQQRLSLAQAHPYTTPSSSPTEDVRPIQYRSWVPRSPSLKSNVVQFRDLGREKEMIRMERMRAAGLGVGDGVESRGSKDGGAVVSRREGGSEVVEWKDLDLPPSLISRLKLAFPHAARPMPSQVALLDAISRKDVGSKSGKGKAKVGVDASESGGFTLLKEETGGGKSFALMLALLRTSERRRNRGGQPRLRHRQSGPTSLLIVPHSSLALQYLSWIKRLYPEYDKNRLGELVQVLVRGESFDAAATAGTGSFDADILIATPTALADVLRLPSESDKKGKRKSARELGGSEREGGEEEGHPAFPPPPSLTSIKILAIDEPDSLLSSIPPRFPTLKDLKRWKAHRPILMDVVDRILPPTPLSRPQVVLLAATANSVFRNWLLTRSGWIVRGERFEFLDFEGTRRRLAEVDEEEEAAELDEVGSELDPVQDSGRTWRDSTGVSIPIPESIRHHCIVVSDDGSVRNLDVDSSLQRPVPASSSPHSPTLPPAPARNVPLPPIWQDPQLLESIATALVYEQGYSDDERVKEVGLEALVFLPDGCSVVRTREAFEGFGLRVRDVVPGSEGGFDAGEGCGEGDEPLPIIYLTTVNNAPGLDIPGLTHVVVPFVPRDLRSYWNMAGRVSRLGSSESGTTTTGGTGVGVGRREGKVIGFAREGEGGVGTGTGTDGRGGGVEAGGDVRGWSRLMKLGRVDVRPFEHLEQ